MRKIIFFILLIQIIVLVPKAHGQNLVLNPNFESVNAGNLLCSWYLSSAEFSSAINNWTCPTGGSTDVFSSTLATSCFCSTNSTHASAKGPQAPRSGNTYIPIVVYGSGGCTPYREYLQGQLSSSLIVGQQYCIEFYVSMADYNHYATNNIGVYFTTAPVNNASMCVYSVTPQVNYSGPPITDYTGWTMLSFTFTPTQAFNYFTIGNFYTDAATTATTMPGSLTTCRYYIEDVSIQLCSSAPVITVNNATICAGDTATLTATSTSGGTTYSWSNGQTGNPIYVSPITTTSYTVTGTASGQTGTATAIVTVHTPPTVSFTNTPPTICNGTSTTLTVTGANTYAWSPSGSGNSNSVSPNTTTTYTVTGTDGNGCTATAQQTVTVQSNPTVNLGPDQSICQGQSYTFDATTAGATYLWSNGATTPTISPSVSGNYSVTVTVNGCTGNDNVSLTVNPIPTVNLGADQSICQGQTYTFDATTPGATYLWSNGATTPTISPGVSGNYSVTVTVNGCSGSDAVTLSVNPNLVVNLGPDQSICQGQTALFDATTTGATYLWSTSETTPTISAGTSGTYSVTVTANGCSGSDDANLIVTPNPVVNLGTDQSICQGQSTIFDATTQGGSYIWSTGDTTATITTSISGNYSVTVTVNGCSGSDNITNTVNSNPVITATADPTEICIGGTTTISASGGVSYIWDNGSQADSFTELQP